MEKYEFTSKEKDTIFHFTRLLIGAQDLISSDIKKMFWVMVVMNMAILSGIAIILIKSY